ncbi:MAG: NAD(P)H-binding protein [Actinobacteria bacterium]|nr:NAD(P)H-binding protein [Actinomycetota bacterium]
MAVRVVVIGATGNVGSSLVAALADDPVVSEVVGVARRTANSGSPKVRHVALDVADDDLAPHIEGADAVISAVLLSGIRLPRARLSVDIHTRPDNHVGRAPGTIRVVERAAGSVNSSSTGGSTIDEFARLQGAAETRDPKELAADVGTRTRN